MTPEEAAWVHKHVICGWMATAPLPAVCGPDQNLSPRCRCQHPCTWCRDGLHDVHERFAQWEAENGPWPPEPETRLVSIAPDRRSWNGRRVVGMPVWLADRACRDLCHCETCDRPAAPPDRVPASEPVQPWPAQPVYELAALPGFEEYGP